MMYNSVMINDVPNFGFIMGYTNASWTLKADIASIYFTKLLNHMKVLVENNTVPYQLDFFLMENIFTYRTIISSKLNQK